MISAICSWHWSHSGAVVPAVENTRGMKEALSVFITLELYFVFFPSSFLLYSLSNGTAKFDGALGWVVLTSINVLSLLPKRPVATMSSLAPSAVIVPFGWSSAVPSLSCHLVAILVSN